MARTWFWPRPKALAISLRKPCGAWFEVQMVSPRVIGSGAATTPRVSIGMGWQRGARILAFTLTGAAGERGIDIAVNRLLADADVVLDLVIELGAPGCRAS